MRAEQRHKSTELMPAGLELLPLVLPGGIVELAHYGETANVHAPKRDSAHGVVQTGGHLHAHIGPGSANVAAPGGGAVALQARKAVAREEEYALVRVHAALAFVNGLGVHQGVGIQVFGAGAQFIGIQQPFHVVQGQAVSQVRLTGVHPPGVNLAAILGVQTLVHLLPEELPATGGVGVIERLRVAQPVFEAVLFGMQVHITGILKFLVMLRIGVEFGPHGNHEAAVQGVDVVQHLFRVRETGGFKGVTPPLVVFPVLPVLDNVVHRDMSLAQLLEGFYQVFLRGIPLAALPETQHPLGHHGCLTGELAVVLDYRIIAFSAQEIVVQLGFTLAPEGELVLLHRPVRLHPKANVGYIPVRFPVNADGRGHAGFQVHGVLVAVGVPGRTPAAAHHFLPTDYRALETGIVLNKVVIACLMGGYSAFVGDFCALQRNLGQVPDGKFVLVEEAVFLLHQHPGFGSVGALQLQVKDLSQLLVGLVGTPSTQGIGVEEEAVAFAGNHHGNTHLGVVLVEFLLAAFVVKLPGLMLAQAIEGFVRGTVKGECGAPAVSVRDQGGMAAQGERGAIGLVKVDFTAGFVHIHSELAGGQVHLAHGVGYLKVHAALLWQYYQALPVCKLPVFAGAHADNFRGNHLQAEGIRGTLYRNILLLAGAESQGQKDANSSVKCNFHILNYLRKIVSVLLPRRFFTIVSCSATSILQSSTPSRPCGREVPECHWIWPGWRPSSCGRHSGRLPDAGHRHISPL